MLMSRQQRDQRKNMNLLCAFYSHLHTLETDVECWVCREWVTCIYVVEPGDIRLHTFICCDWDFSLSFRPVFVSHDVTPHTWGPEDMVTIILPPEPIEPCDTSLTEITTNAWLWETLFEFYSLADDFQSVQRSTNSIQHTMVLFELCLNEIERDYSC